MLGVMVSRYDVMKDVLTPLKTNMFRCDSLTDSVNINIWRIQRMLDRSWILSTSFHLLSMIKLIHLKFALYANQQIKLALMWLA